MKIFRQWTAAALAGLLLLGMAGCQKQTAAPEPDAVGKQFTVDANVVTDEAADFDEMLSSMQQKVDEGTINLEIQNEIIVEDGSPTSGEPVVGTGFLANSKQNRHPVVITIMENNEIIFQSGLIPVGGRLEQVKFNRTLAPRDHHCVATYSLLDEETQESVGAASFELTVKVLT